MRKIKLIMFTATILLVEKGFAQLDTIKWDTDRYSLVSELGKVWIDLHKGPNIKNAKIQSVDTISGKIVYLYEGTFHDLSITKIRMITPGKFFDHYITFKRNTPIIKEYPESPGYDIGTFKYYQMTKTAVHAAEQKPMETQTVNLPKKEVAETIKAGADARVVFGNGKQLDVKLISLSQNEISYKRADLPDGPLYILGLGIPGTLRFARITKENGITTIDYSR